MVCIDGFDPDYLDACKAPNLKEICRKGFFKIGYSMMPSVTNVNNVSLVTGLYPESHGINCNYWFDQGTGQEMYMESGSHILTKTVFQQSTEAGKHSLMVSAKDKLRTLIGNGATVSFSSEKPLKEVVQAIGDPPQIYSLEVNGWIINAANHLMSNRYFDGVYITTTDYAMHTYAPDNPYSQKHITILDQSIGQLLETHPDITLLITADHGMSTKTKMVDLKTVLDERGIRANPIPIIKDRYVVHHANLGGSMFVYLDDSDEHEAVEILKGTPGVHSALTKAEAVEQYRLHPDRLGNIVVNGDKDVVFGNPSLTDMRPGLRSHASIHERKIPLIGYNCNLDVKTIKENRQLGQYFISQVLS